MSLMIDISGLSLTPDEKIMLAKPSVCGVILFTRNYQDKQQLKQLVEQIRSIKPNLLIATDHEGGRVQRFKKDFTHIPPMASLGELFTKDKQLALKSAYACGFVLAYELLEVGIDFSFTPVLDIDYGNNSVIGNRAFSSDAKIIIQLASSLIEGMKKAGMVSVVKHFPGHGFVSIDTHLNLATDKRTLDEMRTDLSAFKALLHKADVVMPAHITYEKLDNKPAGFSKFWLQNILKDKFNYNGLIISDDLSMQGAVNFLPSIVDRVKLALNAGCDIALICNNHKQVKKLIDNSYPSCVKLDKIRVKNIPKLDKIYAEQLNIMQNKYDFEIRLLDAMRKTLIAVATDTMTKPGLKHPLSKETQLMISDCFGIISNRRKEIEQKNNKYTKMKPVFSDEQTTQSIDINDIKK